MLIEQSTKQNLIGAGGTVIAGSVDQHGRLLIATSAGLFRREDDRWSPLPNQPSIPFLQTFAYSDGFIFLGGANLIVFSTDDGRTWNRGQTTALEKPVTCLAVSPGFAQDRVVLAGTDGAGILRSTDGGKYWHYSSFGLQDSSITALASAPVWSSCEIVFAATAGGLYRSPNGGRAWKSANHGLANCTVLSIAPSPNYSEDGIVLVGTESDGIFRSDDGGFTWQPCAAGLSAVNALWLSSDGETCLAGLDDGHLLRSQTGGVSWAADADASAPILCFISHDQRLFAGAADAGLMTSEDGGRTWETDTELACRQFTSLLSGANHRLFAFGADEGILCSDDAGFSWVPTGDFESLLLTAATANDALHTRLAGTANGLFRADDAAPEWRLVALLPDVTTIHFSEAFAKDRRAWAGTWGGDVFASTDNGRVWQSIQPPPTHAPIVSLGAFHDSVDSEQLTAITFNPRLQLLALWQRTGGTWQIWLEAPSPAPIGNILTADAGEMIVSLGAQCWLWADGKWRSILKADKPIIRLLRHPSHGLIALTADSIRYSTDAVNWTTVNPSPDGSFNDLALLPDDTICILTRGGTLVYDTLPK